MDNKEFIFKTVQKFLNKPPLIIWGSGATIPYGLPSMEDLKNILNSTITLNANANLEVELGNIADEDKIYEIKKIIRHKIAVRDKECLEKALQDVNYFESIIAMVKKFYNPHPRKVDIVTTNYDCVLEYALSQSNYNFTDGFTGKPLAKFDSSYFGDTRIINLIKVHGSLNWFFKNGNIFYLPSREHFPELGYAMILPAKQKYLEATREPYRTLIQKSDNVINNANSFLAVGFGFNDEHLTPKVDEKIKTGCPIVLITKKATKSCKEKLRSAEKYCLFEEEQSGTEVKIKEDRNSAEKSFQLEEDYWKLGKFMEIL